MFDWCRVDGPGWPSVLVSLLVLTAGCATFPTDEQPSASPTPDLETTPGDGIASETAANEEPTTADSDPTPATDAPTTHATDVLAKHASLDSRLVGLLNAENRTAYATSRDLDLRNESVLVVVELRPNRSLPADFDLQVRTRHENLVQARVPLAHLVALTEHPNVSYVRPPREPATDSLSEEHSPNDTSSA